MEFNQEHADILCERLSNSDQSIRAICESLSSESFPSESTIYRWLRVESGFRQQYAHARQNQADFMGFLAYQHAKTPLVGEIRESSTTEKGFTEKTVTKDNVERSRLMYDAAKWQAGKLNPKKWGDKIEMEHSGGVILINDIPDPDYSQRDK